jgi:hypothetical protein
VKGITSSTTGNVVTTTIKDVGNYLEEQARLGEPVTYSQVIQRFPDLPPLSAAWKSHPLCSIFGELDDEDHLKKRPFRTALVVGKETNRPGQGFFDTISNLCNKTMLKSEYDSVWVAEFHAVKTYYQTN